MKRVFIIICLYFSIINVFAKELKQDFVNPFIGTSNSGNTHPGALVPWGMVSVCPQNVDLLNSNVNFASSYIFGGERFYGFTHTNLSGVGCPDKGSIILTPMSYSALLESRNNGHRAENEIAKVGYYSVQLNDIGVRAEATATQRTGISRFTFNEGKGKIVLNLCRSLSSVRGAWIKCINDSTIVGYKTDGNFCGWGNHYDTYFALRFSSKPEKLSLYKNGVLIPDRYAEANDLGFEAMFSNLHNEQIEVNVGISYVSGENALENLILEAGNRTFDQLLCQAQDQWEAQLSIVNVEGSSVDDKVKFYTAMYHMLIHPNVISDVNGEYPLMGKRKGVGRNPYPRYSVFSLWDTYRNLHPLMCLLFPEQQLDMVRSMVDMYKENGWLPKWELNSTETHVMVGDPALPVIADTYMRGLKNFDVYAAYEAMLKHSDVGVGDNFIRPALKQYIKYGYIPQDDKEAVWGSVATSLEYYIADWSVAKMAKMLGDSINYEKYYKRSLNYNKLFDEQYQLLRPKFKDGSWLEPFDPVTVEGEQDWIPSGGPGFVEGNAWQYTWMVPHDVKGLIRRYESEKQYVTKLQECFDKGYFELWNEPDMAYPYLFNYVKGEEWRTQKEVKNCINKYFHTGSGGIPGNDDCGTMSAWLIYSMIGLYSVCPADEAYALTIPSFDKVTIKLDKRYYKGEKIEICTVGAGVSGARITKVHFNDQKLSEMFIDHGEITRGGVLRFETKY